MDWDFEWEFGPGGFMRGLWRALAGLASLFGGLILLLLFLAVAVLLIRYLLVATKAAQLYVDAHTPSRPDAGPGVDSTPEPEPTPPAPAASDAATTDAAPTKPARAPRTPRTPRTPSTS